MSHHNNGAKTFIYVVRYSRGVFSSNVGPSSRREQFYLIRADRDPTADELIALLHLDYDETHDELDAQRYDLDALPVLK